MSELIVIYFAMGAMIFLWPCTFKVVQSFRWRPLQPGEWKDWLLIWTLGWLLWPLYVWHMWEIDEGKQP